MLQGGAVDPIVAKGGSGKVGNLRPSPPTGRSGMSPLQLTTNGQMSPPTPPATTLPTRAEPQGSTSAVIQGGATDRIVAKGGSGKDGNPPSPSPNTHTYDIRHTIFENQRGRIPSSIFSGCGSGWCAVGIAKGMGSGGGGTIWNGGASHSLHI